MASSARIDELRKKFEENPRRYFAPLANEYRKTGAVDEAIAICREFLPQQPGHMSGHIVYGQALYEARQFEEAKAVFETALSLDPENLIALRHLGDIALIVGDAEGARGWYRRVLEADPRNEEIQAQLATLDKATQAPAAPAAPAEATPPAGAPAAATKPTPSSAPTIVMSAVPTKEVAQAEAPSQAPEQPVDRPLETVTPESPTAEIHLDTVAPVAPPATSAAAPPPQALELESPVAGASPQDAPPLDTFSLEGLEATSLAPSSAPAAPAPAPTLPDLDLGPMASQSAPTPPAPQPLPDLEVTGLASAPPPQPETPQPAPELPLLDLGAPAPAPAADLPLLDLGAPAPPPAPEAALPDLDLGDFAAPPPASAPVAAAPPPVESVAPALDDLSVAPQEIPEPPPESGPFVTETMAELYLQQGHREEALRVYRALLEQRPDDAALRARVAQLEGAVVAPPAGREPDAAPPTGREPDAAPRVTAHREGPSIREVLMFVALRRPGFRPESPRQNGGTPASAEPERIPLAGDGLGYLFGSAGVSPADESAAMTLALAFVGLNGDETAASQTAQAEQGLVGSPARPAATELSLDNVFGGSAAAQPAPSSFSFDQFFSQRAASETPAGPTAVAGGAPASRDDVAQFTSWLEGLKQR